MKQPSSKTRRPRSLRQEQGAAAPAVVKSGLALSLSTAMLVPLSAMAQQAAEQQLTQNTELPAVKVQATKIDPNPNAELGAPYKAKTSGDVRHTRPLAETPQTISVITKTAIDDSGFTASPWAPARTATPSATATSSVVRKPAATCSWTVCATPA